MNPDQLSLPQDMTNDRFSIFIYWLISARLPPQHRQNLWETLGLPHFA